MSQKVLRSRVRLACCGFLGLAGLAAQAEEARDPLRLGGRIRPLEATLALELDPARVEFSGRVVLELWVTEPTAEIVLHADRLKLEYAQFLPALESTKKDPVKLELEVRGDRWHFQTPEPLTIGRGRLEIVYRGIVEELDSAGLFRQRDGEDWYLFSQLQPYDARRVFPGFDEPSFKIPWSVELRVPDGLVALSNMPSVGEVREASGWKTVRFETSPPLPSYLLAFAVGPFEFVDGGRVGRKGVPSRVVVPKGRKAEGEYAARTTPAIVSALEEYFDIPYPYPKLDQIALPHTVGFGAMENPGLITYVERLILIRSADLTEERRRAWGGVAAHELAHQWFGNYVTLAWWDDTWLNEGFATWMTHKVLERVHPEWRADLSRLERRSAAMGSDALPSARRVRQPIRSSGDIRNAFDAITYSKGASLLSMFEGWVGEEGFRQAVRTYLGRHAHGTATAMDFLETLGKVTDPKLASSFTRFLDQAGIPEVAATLRCETGRAPVFELEQRRFLPQAFRFSGATSEELWEIPVRLRVATEQGMEEFRILLDQRRGRLELPEGTPCPTAWFGNATGRGYYLVRTGSKELGQQLDPATPLEVGERFALLTEVRLRMGAGELPADEALRGLQPWSRAPERQLVEASASIVRAARRWVPEDRVGAFAAWVRGQFRPQLEYLGLLPVPGELEDWSLLRNQLIRLLAREGTDSQLRAWAKERLYAGWENPAAVPAAVRSAVLEAAAAGGEGRLWEEIVERARREANRRWRQQLLSALGQFEDPALLVRSWGLLLDPSWDIRDALGILQELPSSAHASRAFLAWFEQSLDVLLSRLPEQLRARVPGWAAGLCSKEEGARLRTLLEPRLSRDPGFERNLNLALETIEICASAAPVQQAALLRFLEP